jgi:heme-degrading monooxygenase HmoA
MYARVTTYQGPPNQEHEPELFAQVLANLRQQPGFRGIYTTTQPETGKVLSLSLWETQEQARNVDAATAQHRDPAAQERGFTGSSVEVYEVLGRG